MCQAPRYNTRGIGEADTDIYESQLMAPTRPSEGMHSPMEPLWEDLDKVIFLKTQAEKQYSYMEKECRREAPRRVREQGCPSPLREWFGNR